MDNYLTRERLPTVTVGALIPLDDPRVALAVRQIWKSQANTKRADGDRTSTGGIRVKSYAETPGRHPDRLIPANPSALGKDLAAALAQLSPKQRIVYEARVLTEPKVSQSELAHQLKSSPPAISKLEKKARQRMTRLLRGGSQVGG
jgi:hypothetical protein